MEKYVSVIEILAHGIDPVTGEELPEHSPYNNPEVIRALFFALSSMEQNQRGAGLSTPAPLIPTEHER